MCLSLSLHPRGWRSTSFCRQSENVQLKREITAAVYNFVGFTPCAFFLLFFFYSIQTWDYQWFLGGKCRFSRQNQLIRWFAIHQMHKNTDVHTHTFCRLRSQLVVGVYVCVWVERFAFISTLTPVHHMSASRTRQFGSRGLFFGEAVDRGGEGGKCLAEVFPTHSQVEQDTSGISIEKTRYVCTAFKSLRG